MQTLKSCLSQLKKGTITSQELTLNCLNRIKSSTNNSFVNVNPNAIEQARQCDRRLSQGKGGVLEGVPLGVKDLFVTKNLPTTACSNMLSGFMPNYESTVTQRLWNEGAFCMGKLNMDEFAMGGYNVTSCYGHTINPLNPLLTSGGSSGGSAVAVASGLVPASIGSETGDSVRAPSAMCGVVGLKPSFGRVSRFGMISYSSSFDCAGFVTQTVEDAVILLGITAGQDNKDVLTSNNPVPCYQASKDVSGLKIGVVKELCVGSSQTQIATQHAIRQLERNGAEVVELSIPHAKFAGAVYGILANAEASSNFSRYDGIRFGHRKNGTDLDDMYSQTRKGFGWEIKRRLVIGSYILLNEHYNDYFVQAQRVRRIIYNEMMQAFERVDAIVSPTLPSVPPSLSLIYDSINNSSNSSSNNFNSLKQFNEELDILNLPMSMAGVPCISLPVQGFWLGSNIPASVQVTANRMREDVCVGVAGRLEELLQG